MSLLYHVTSSLQLYIKPTIPFKTPITAMMVARYT